MVITSFTADFGTNGTATNAGAVTFGDGDTGIAGVVGFDNSLVGSSPNDQIGNLGISVLENGNYVVSSPQWDNGSVLNAGAVTFGDGTTGVADAISAANSLVGSITGDIVGNRGVTVLESGNYVVQSSRWSNGSAIQAGAVTFGNRSTGVKGAVSAANSLVGSSDNERVGNRDVITLENGNYIVQNAGWDNGSAINAGAVTFGDGNNGVAGVVSAANSLVGSSEGDNVGFVRVLENGNYIVISPEWDNGSVTDAGAVTFGDGITGVAGIVGAVNSLVGSSPNDRVGSGGVTYLENGNYVVNSDLWDNGSVVDAGAITLGNGNVGVTGVVSPVNSLVGTGPVTNFAAVVPLLTDSNYLIVTHSWNDGAGAVTFVNGTVGVVGEINAENSLIGSSAGDRSRPYLRARKREITSSAVRSGTMVPSWMPERSLLAMPAMVAWLVKLTKAIASLARHQTLDYFPLFPISSSTMRMIAFLLRSVATEAGGCGWVRKRLAFRW